MISIVQKILLEHTILDSELGCAWRKQHQTDIINLKKQKQLTNIEIRN